MPVNEMFEKIRNDFLAANPQDVTDVALLQTFCEYATKWLADTGLVGIGHTTNGMSLRFANGEEYLLTAAPPADKPVADMPAFSITGNNGGSVRAAGAVQDSSMPITG